MTGLPSGLQSSIDLPALLDLSAKGLSTMFDPHRGLFCFTRRRVADNDVRSEGHSHRYSIMSLLGLHKLHTTCGAATGIPLRDVTRGLLRDREWLDNVGDLGLLLWLCALVTPDDLPQFVAQAQVSTALSQFPDPAYPTMELAWMLTGLAYAVAVRPDSVGDALHPLAQVVVTRLRQNQGPHGFFGHLTTRSGLTGRLRGHIGSFADQAYPIYALARFGEAQGHAQAVGWARQCADAICATQGPLGQWWWHFDAARGHVAQRLPAYAVHQEGMAPMALFAAEQASGVSYRKAAYAGLEWLLHNELACDLRNRDLGLVWRSIEIKPTWLASLAAASQYFGYGLQERLPPTYLRVNEECRPYELGWLLYAFADEAAHTPGRSRPIPDV